MWLYAFSSVDRILTGNFAFWTCALCLRIADFIHLHRTFLTYLKILINSFSLSLHMNLPNSFVRSMKAKLSHRIQKLLHVRTIKTNPALHASSLLHKKPPFQRSTAPSSKRVPRKHTQYRMKIRKHCPCCPAQNLPVTRISQRTPPPSLRRYRARQKNSLHSDRQLGATKHALADMDGRLCASQVAEQSMQHPAKGRQKARSLHRSRPSGLPKSDRMPPSVSFLPRYHQKTDLLHRARRWPATRLRKSPDIVNPIAKTHTRSHIERQGHFASPRS